MQKEPKDAILVCSRYPGNQPELRATNKEGSCSICNARIVYRPHAPERWVKVCNECYEKEEPVGVPEMTKATYEELLELYKNDPKTLAEIKDLKSTIDKINSPVQEYSGIVVVATRESIRRHVEDLGVKDDNPEQTTSCHKCKCTVYYSKTGIPKTDLPILFMCSDCRRKELGLTEAQWRAHIRQLPPQNMTMETLEFLEKNIEAFAARDPQLREAVKRARQALTPN